MSAQTHTTPEVAGRWGRLIRCLEDRGVTVTQAYRPNVVVAFGRCKRTVDTVLRLRLDDRLIEVTDEVDLIGWRGWVVTVTDADGAQVLAFAPTRRGGDAADNVLTAIACTLLAPEEADQ